MTVWQTIPEYPDYEASVDGSVRSKDRTIKSAKVRGGKRKLRGKILKPQQSGTGHLQVDVWRDRVPTRELVHRLVLQAFRGPCPKGQCARFRDGDPSNTALDNLYWGVRGRRGAE